MNFFCCQKFTYCSERLSNIKPQTLSAVYSCHIEFGHDKNSCFWNCFKENSTEKKLTQEELSLQADLARAYVSELEFGKKTASIETVFKLSKALNIKCSKLMDLVEEEF